MQKYLLFSTYNTSISIVSAWSEFEVLIDLNPSRHRWDEPETISMKLMEKQVSMARWNILDIAYLSIFENIISKNVVALIMQRIEIMKEAKFEKGSRSINTRLTLCGIFILWFRVITSGKVQYN